MVLTSVLIVCGVAGASFLSGAASWKIKDKIAELVGKYKSNASDTKNISTDVEVKTDDPIVKKSVIQKIEDAVIKFVHDVENKFKSEEKKIEKEVIKEVEDVGKEVEKEVIKEVEKEVTKENVETVVEKVVETAVETAFISIV